MELVFSHALSHTDVFVLVNCFALLDTLNILFPAEARELKCPLLSQLLYFLEKIKVWAQICVCMGVREDFLSPQRGGTSSRQTLSFI